MHNVAHQTKDGERKLVTKYVRNGQGNTLGICGRCTIKQCMWFCICTFVCVCDDCHSLDDGEGTTILMSETFILTRDEKETCIYRHGQEKVGLKRDMLGVVVCKV